MRQIHAVNLFQLLLIFQLWTIQYLSACFIAPPPSQQISAKRGPDSRLVLLGWVKARYWKPKTVFRRSRNTSPVQTRSIITVHTQILTHITTIFSKIMSLFVFASRYFLIYKLFYQNMYKHNYILIKSVSCFTLMVT